MTTILQPKVADSQQLIRAAIACNVQRMVVSLEKEKTGFARRFRAALDYAGILDDRQRRGWIATTFKVSVETARKWLTGESIPATKRIPVIAEQLKVRGEWLLTGQGQMEAGGVPPSIQQAPSSRPDIVSIPQYGAGGAMGDGGLVLPDQPGVIERWSVSAEWLRKNVNNYTSFDNLCIVTGFGPSMRPMFNPGDPLLCDRGVRTVNADGVFFFRIGEEGFIKQLQKIPTPAGVIYRAKSKNTDFDPFDITPDMDFEVLARVIRVWCGTDF